MAFGDAGLCFDVVAHVVVQENTAFSSSFWQSKALKDGSIEAKKLEAVQGYYFEEKCIQCSATFAIAKLD
eukprot:13273387-Ditylum_brightwellii.AAC.1